MYTIVERSNGDGVGFQFHLLQRNSYRFRNAIPIGRIDIPGQCESKVELRADWNDLTYHVKCLESSKNRWLYRTYRPSTPNIMAS